MAIAPMYRNTLAARNVADQALRIGRDAAWRQRIWQLLVLHQDSAGRGGSGNDSGISRAAALDRKKPAQYLAHRERTFTEQSQDIVPPLDRESVKKSGRHGFRNI